MAGGGTQGNGDGGPARAGQLSGGCGIDVAPDGAVVLAENAGFASRVRRVASPLSRLTGTQLFAPSTDGRDLYVFSALGRHEQTVDALTGTVRWQFGYTPEGFLQSVTDADNNVTTIQRDSTGAPTAIDGPFGRSTALSIDSDGYLESITNPALESTTLTYDAAGGGLLATLTDAKQQAHVFEYDTEGMLTKDTSPSGGSKTLVRTAVGSGHVITLTTGLGRATSYAVSRLTTGDRQRHNTLPNGLEATVNVGADGRRSTVLPDGTQVTSTLSPDPRFGMQAPLVSRTTTTPGGKVLAVGMSRTATLDNPADPLSLTAMVDTVSLNGKSTTTELDVALGTVTQIHTSPEGRVTTSVFDTEGHLLSLTRLGLLPTTFGCDTSGRLAATTQGTRIWTRAYHASGSPLFGELSSITDPLLDVTSFDAYDHAGRLLDQTLPSGRPVSFAYDANGNRTLVKPPPITPTEGCLLYTSPSPRD